MGVRGDMATPELFVNARGQPLTRAGFAFVLKQHVQTAAQQCPSLKDKRVSPHVLRHTCAMVLFRATGDLRKVSLWLGHSQMQTTEVYLRADPMEKIEAIEGMTPAAQAGAVQCAGSVDCFAAAQVIACTCPKPTGVAVRRDRRAGNRRQGAKSDCLAGK